MSSSMGAATGGSGLLGGISSGMNQSNINQQGGPQGSVLGSFLQGVRGLLGLAQTLYKRHQQQQQDEQTQTQLMTDIA